MCGGGDGAPRGRQAAAGRESDSADGGLEALLGRAGDGRGHVGPVAERGGWKAAWER